jgi:hypothetical protein
MTKQATKQISEESMINFMRNALVVAGEEMGDDGDHWPVIKSTVHQMMKTWEDVKIERNVDAELKKHVYAQLAIMEQGLPDCTPEARASIEPKLQELREIYDAYFAEAQPHAAYVDEASLPDFVKRAEIIIATLDGDEE